jgi:hypothetical protein
VEGAPHISNEHEIQLRDHRILRSIEPLDFDPELANDYLACFQSDAEKAFVVGELETLYGELENPGERLKEMELIANPNVCFDSPDSDEW